MNLWAASAQNKTKSGLQYFLTPRAVGQALADDSSCHADPALSSFARSRPLHRLAWNPQTRRQPPWAPRASTLRAAAVRYEHLTSDNVNIAMARPHVRNAQDMQMTHALNDAFDRAAHDDAVKVIVLPGDGPHFSTGHDMGGDSGMTWRNFPTFGT